MIWKLSYSCVLFSEHKNKVKNEDETIIKIKMKVYWDQQYNTTCEIASNKYEK